MGRFLTFILAILTCASYAQQIQAIQNDEQALSFVRKVNTNSYYTICLKPPKPLLEPDARYLPAHEFIHYEKADFDNNGQMDLLFNGFRFDQDNKFSRRISLVIKAPSSCGIESIRFSYTRPYDLNYQSVEIVISPDSTKLKTEDIESDNFCTRIYKIKTQTAFWNQLTELLNRIDFINLEDHYAVPWTCDDTGFLTIEYDNGKTKRISDYGKCGTYSLEIIEELLIAITASPEWTLLAEQDGFMKL